ncbi:MAG: UDP-N-acetylmuramoyl-L-alanine--D-glutamate ligase [Candidatus Colwellbacteria bacterium]|nr:UDP-N-acetylmuramoyl-L-alanine--D-glutamate ligase [Candidatus Colwellbacteria bacterium]
MKIAILGFGQEGKAVLKFLKKTQPGIKPVILDKKRDSNYLKNLGQFDIVYRSPGIPYNLPQIQSAIKKGVKFSSATDLFFKQAKGIIIGVTGTKGKSTVSTLIYKVLKNAGRDVYLGGNIGKPAIELLPKLKKNSITVLELSSFQLQDLKHSPHIAIILDVFPDHLDAHQDLKEYLAAKSNIIKNQKSGDLVFYFSGNKQSRNIALKSNGKKIAVAPDKNIADLKIPGEHNRKNAAMVMAVAKQSKVPQKTILKTLKSFGGLPHRLKLVRTVKGVKFYNDSASTNPETTAAAIMSFPNHLKIIIMGGKDKNLDYEPVAEAAYTENIKLVVIFGENKKKIQLALDKVAKTKPTKDLKSAIKIAFQAAKSGDIVIFSPGAASFDMFKNYKDRGKGFTRIVKKIRA